MRVGENYDCKILLFGIAVDLSDEKAMKQRRFLFETTPRELLICETVDELAVGDRRVLQTTSGGNTYYVTIEDAADLKDKSKFDFRWSRNDIIQVDDIIHPDFLRH